MNIDSNLFIINRTLYREVGSEMYPYRGSSTKSGNNPKEIRKRRKRNKAKKTHRK